jgi:hypothetical protein
MKIGRLIVVLAGIASTGLCVPLASADPPIYPGIACTPAREIGSPYDVTGTPTYTPHGAIQTLGGNEDLWLFCPTAGYGGLEVDTINIRVSDTTTGDYVECKVYCKSFSGTESYESGWEDTQAEGNGTTTFTWSLDEDYTNGGCGIYCRLPDHAEVRSYRVSIQSP